MRCILCLLVLLFLLRKKGQQLAKNFFIHQLVSVQILDPSNDAVGETFEQFPAVAAFVFDLKKVKVENFYLLQQFSPQLVTNAAHQQYLSKRVHNKSRASF